MKGLFGVSVDATPYTGDAYASELRKLWLLLSRFIVELNFRATSNHGTRFSHQDLWPFQPR